jgi:cytochrome c oxidase subunit II
MGMRAGIQRVVKASMVGMLAFAGCMALARPATAADEPKRIEITAKRFSYSPSEITVKKGEPVDLVFHTADVTHGIRFKELGLQTQIGKGSDGELRFTPNKAGDFVGHCSHFCGVGHGSMTMTLHVTE